MVFTSPMEDMLNLSNSHTIFFGLYLSIPNQRLFTRTIYAVLIGLFGWAAWYGLVHKRLFLTTIALILVMIRVEIVLLPLFALLVIAWELGYRRIIVAWLIGIGSLWLYPPCVDWAMGDGFP